MMPDWTSGMNKYKTENPALTRIYVDSPNIKEGLTALFDLRQFPCIEGLPCDTEKFCRISPV